MLWGGSKGGLEVRTSADGSTVLRGRFPYAIPTVLRFQTHNQNMTVAASAIAERNTLGHLS